MLASGEKLSTTKDAYINMVASFVTNYNSREKQSVSYNYAYSPFVSRTEFQETRTITLSLIIHDFKVILPEIGDTKESALCRTICSAAAVITALLQSFQKLIILDLFSQVQVHCRISNITVWQKEDNTCGIPLQCLSLRLYFTTCTKPH